MVTGIYTCKQSKICGQYLLSVTVSISYLRYGSWYLEKVRKLSQENPEIHAKFLEGSFLVRTTQKRVTRYETRADYPNVKKVVKWHNRGRPSMKSTLRNGR